MGWAVGAVLLDFTGGLLSFLQQLIDSLNEVCIHSRVLICEVMGQTRACPYRMLRLYVARCRATGAI